MKYLLPEYWKNVNINLSVKKGKKFEDLVFDLLIAEYGKVTFQNTKNSWDGNKDFYYYSDEEKLWAECKNYTSSIELKVLAASMIMAQISDINTILFFSYTHINVNTKAKLLVNAEKIGKNVYFYDDIVLERKIFQYWNKVGEKYFSNFIFEEFLNEYTENKYEAKCLLYGNPLDMNASVEDYEIEHLTLFKMFEMDICIINRDTESCNFTIGFKNDTEKIKSQFEIYPESLLKSKLKKRIAPFEAKVVKVFLIPIKDNCTLPHIYINSKRISLPSNVEFKSLQVSNQNIQRLIGKSYEDCVSNFRKEVIYVTDQIKSGVLFGHSGTGKSKLYIECLNVSKIDGYEIINYCNLTRYNENTQTVKEFIKKLIINIYHVTIEELEDFFNGYLSSYDIVKIFDERPEFNMLHKIINLENEDDVSQWIDKYIDLIILKMLKNKFLIAIDNVQFLNDNIIDLLCIICRKLTDYKKGKTKFLLTFNTDFIKRDSKADMFLGECISNFDFAFTKRITGFEDSNECLEFLQEVLSIGDIFSSTEVRDISDNMNRNPFYLEQLVYWLSDKRAIELRENKYNVINDILFKKLIRNIPDGVLGLLSDRWKHYKNNNEDNYNNAIVIFSALHLYSELSKNDVEKLKISWNIIKDLEKVGFLNIEDDQFKIRIKFRHDLIEQFFSKSIDSFSDIIINYENNYGITLKENIIRSYFDKLYNKAPLNTIDMNNILSLTVDKRLAYEFYLLVFEKLINAYYNIDRKEKFDWVNNIFRIVVIIHDNLGNAIMNNCIDKLFFIVQNDIQLVCSIEYGNLLLYISEAYDSMGRYIEATQIIRNYLNIIIKRQGNQKFDEVWLMLLSRIYNRLHVYQRHQMAQPLKNRDVMKNLEISEKIANNINYATMQYVNYSDRGYLYYDLPQSNDESQNTIVNWKQACMVYEKGGAEEKTLNYIRKKVQLHLLNGNSEDAINEANNGLAYIECGEFSYQQTFFKWWFYHALVEGYLLNYTETNNYEIEYALECSNYYSDLLESNKRFYYLQLKAIYLFYSGKMNEAKLINDEAIKLVQLSNYNKKKQSLKKQLLENAETIHNIPKSSNCLYSQIHTADSLFNLPCI